MRRTHTFCLVACACCFVFCAASSVSAQAAEPTAVSSASERAADLYQRATSAYRANNLADAEALYREAWALQQSYDIATNLGAVELDLKRYRDAAEHLAFALRTFPARGKQDERETIAARLKLAKAEVVTLSIRVNVDKADVSVNGKRVGVAPISEEVFADAGAVTVEVGLAGYEPGRQAVEAKKGDAKALSFAMMTSAAPKRSQMPAYVIGGVGIASLIAGGVLVGAAESQKADLATRLPRDAKGNLICVRTAPDAHPDCPALRAQATGLDALGNAGIATLVVGGVALAGAAAYYFWPEAKASPSKPASRLVPIVGREGGGLVWIGTF